MDFVKEKLTMSSCQSTVRPYMIFSKNAIVSLCTSVGIANIEGKRIMECNREKNLEKCNCTYELCPRKGICCECIAYHLKMRQLPGCCFSKDAERTYDRSFEHFSRLVQQGKI